MNAEVKLRMTEQTAEIKRLAEEGKSSQAIAATLGLDLGKVRYRLKLLRSAQLIPRRRRSPASGVGHSLMVDGMPGAVIEEIKVIACPYCRKKFQVL